MRGYAVYAAGRSDSEDLEETLRAIRSHSEEGGIVTGDMADPAAIDAVFDEVASYSSGIDVLVNNAAIRPSTPFAEITSAEWDSVLNVNLRGPFLCSQRAARQMKKNGRGSIINIAGVDAYWGTPRRAHVVSSKAGLVGLTRALAAELADCGIRANAVVLGFVETTRSLADSSPLRTKWKDARIQRTLLKRPASLDEVANVVEFLAGDQSSYITGQEIHVNGGGWPTVRGDDSEHSD